MEILSKLFDGMSFLFVIAGIMIITNIVKSNGYFIPLYSYLEKKIKQKRLLVVLISAVSGVLPITGRTIVSAGALDTLAPKDNRRKIFGIIDYLSTHHYYFWSPLEATVLVSITVLQLTYAQYFMMILPLLATLIGMILFYLFFILKEDDIAIEKPAQKPEQKIKKKFSIKDVLKGIKWDLIGFVGLIIVTGNFLKMHAADITDYLMQFQGELFYSSLIVFLTSFALGSSSKFAGISALMAGIFGVQYLPFFFAIGYAGYMFSPMHKCLIIAKKYFGTSTIKLYQVIFIINMVLITIGYFLI